MGLSCEFRVRLVSTCHADHGHIVDLGDAAGVGDVLRVPAAREGYEHVAMLGYGTEPFTKCLVIAVVIRESSKSCRIANKSTNTDRNEIIDQMKTVCIASSVADNEYMFGLFNYCEWSHFLSLSPMR